MSNLILGATAMAYFAIAAFFFRFWRRSRDRLFGIFGFAFLVLALNRVVLGLLGAMGVLDAHGEVRTYLYGVRLLAFLLILFAIVDKNRATR